MIKVIQFGEGNFLRSFVDLYFDTLNKEGFGPFEVTIYKPITFGSVEPFKKANCKYHVILRGREEGKDVENVYAVDAVKDVKSPFDDLDEFYSFALDKELKVLVSNTTEAGIVFNKEDKFDDFEGLTYPGKLTKFLYHRYKAGLDGIYLLPVELIDHNGDELHKDVDLYISLWGLGEDFRKWNNERNFYCSTLVDRIVSGFPRDTETRNHVFSLIGKEDNLCSIAEPFGLWVIEDKGDIAKILKDGHHNIDVIFAKDITYYKKRKVRVLNGSHTNLVPISLWLGKKTVYDVMKDEKLSAFVDATLTNDIIPFVSDDIKATTAFANSVKERFLNPFLNHQLTSIALNSISKWKARDLCSFVDYVNVKGSLPKYLTIGFAYLINMYQHIEKAGDKFVCHLPGGDIDVLDDERFLTYFSSGRNLKDFLSDISIWGMDLTSFKGLEEQLEAYLKDIKSGKSLI